MNGEGFLLDTNIVIALFANETTVVEKVFANKEIYIPSIVLRELYYGALLSSRKEENSNKIDLLVQASDIIVCDQNTARFYGELKAKPKYKGAPIPENDIWIAALAIQHQLKLASRDKHFESIDGLDIVKW